jgi:hypothetical protein
VLYLPPYLLDLNPIEEAFAKLEALVRRAAVMGPKSLLRRWAWLSTQSLPGMCSRFLLFVLLQQTISRVSMEFVLQFQVSGSPCTSKRAKGVPSPVILRFWRFSSSCRAWYSCLLRCAS